MQLFTTMKNYLTSAVSTPGLYCSMTRDYKLVIRIVPILIDHLYNNIYFDTEWYILNVAFFHVVVGCILKYYF